MFHPIDFGSTGAAGKSTNPATAHATDRKKETNQNKQEVHKSNLTNKNTTGNGGVLMVEMEGIAPSSEKDN